MIKKIRCLNGPVVTCSLEWDNFLKHAKSIVHTIRDVPDEELKIQYRSFVEKIHNHYNDIKREWLGGSRSLPQDDALADKIDYSKTSNLAGLLI